MRSDENWESIRMVMMFNIVESLRQLRYHVEYVNVKQDRDMMNRELRFGIKVIAGLNQEEMTEYGYTKCLPESEAGDFSTYDLVSNMVKEVLDYIKQEMWNTVTIEGIDNGT